MNLKACFSVAIWFLVSVASAQPAMNKDSLINITHSRVNDSLKVVAYCQLLQITSADEKVQAEYYLKSGEMLAKKSGNDFLYGEIYRHFAYYSLAKHNNYSGALKFIKLAIDHYEKINSYRTLMYAHAFLAREIFEKLGMNSETLSELKKTVHYAKIAKAHDYIHYLYVLGWFETYNDNPDSAFKHLNMAYARIDPNDNSMNVELLIWMGNTFNAKNDYEKALSYHLKAAKIAEAANLNDALMDCYRYSAYSYRELGKNKEANAYMKKCADYYIANKRFDRIHYVCSSLVTWYARDKRFSEAVNYVRVLLDTTEFNFRKEDELRSYVDMALYNYFYAQGEFKQAVSYLNDYLVINDSINSRKERFKLGELNLKMEFKQQQESDAFEQQKKDLETQSQLQSQKLRTYAFLFGFILVAAMLFFAYRNNKQRQRAFRVISAQKKEVEVQKNLVEEKNREVLDSIHYAKRIQSALMDHEDTIKTYLPDHFIFFKPKAIVSGDFYWAATQNTMAYHTGFPMVEDISTETTPTTDWLPANRPEQFSDNEAIRKQKKEEIQREKESMLFYLAVCDSTGHGVPGAFMSLLNIGFLSEAIKEKDLNDPAQVFQYVRTRLVKTISKDGQKDGFDGVLLCYNKLNNTFTYSAALNAPLMVVDGQVKKLAYDKIPVGQADHMQPFTTYTVRVKKGDVLYLYTDGFGDQFGGEKGRKFKSANLEKLLHEHSHFPMNQQCSNLEKVFSEWKGNFEQLDDVCIVGIRF